MRKPALPQRMVYPKSARIEIPFPTSLVEFIQLLKQQASELKLENPEINLGNAESGTGLFKRHLNFSWTEDEFEERYQARLQEYEKELETFKAWENDNRQAMKRTELQKRQEENRKLLKQIADNERRIAKLSQDIGTDLNNGLSVQTEMV